MASRIEIEALGKTYRSRSGAPITAVQNLSLTITDGQVVGLLGPHGAGKTTAIKLIGGFTKPTAGSVRLHGIDVVRQRTAALHQVGTLLEDRPALRRRQSVHSNLRRAGRAAGLVGEELDARSERLLHAFNLWERRYALIATLSSSQQRIVALASTVVADPPVILLDEPTRDLDGPAAREVLTAVRQLIGGKTIILATSHLAIACDLCDRIIILSGGRVVAERTSEELLGVLRQERYEIRVHGHLSSAWSDWFDGLSVTNLDGGEATIIGTIPDQAALHGLLARMHALNLPLVGVRRIEPDLDDVVQRLAIDQAPTML